MARFIIHSGGKYNIYGTITDAPYFTEGCTLDQLKNWIKENEGQSGLDDLPPRLERAHRKGTSCLDDDEDLYSTIICNRAGKNEKCLEFEEFVEQFLAPVS